MDDVVQVQLRFTIHDPETGVDFTDALYFTQDEFDNYSDEAIEAMKQSRFDTWKEMIADAQKVEPPSPEEIIAGIDTEIATLEKQRDQAVADAESD